jgi:CMP-N,N'-diacetyllegionaminic acid synthase
LKPLVVIPARGGSKGVPGKNIRLLNGKPLINHTINAARQVFDDAVICVSTDDAAIKATAESVGLQVPFTRPAALATDNSGTYEVLLHAVDYYEKAGYFPDVMILLQPTSPFRTAQQIEQALKLYSDDIDMVVSVKEAKSNPYYNLFEENEDGFLSKSKKAAFTRRQDCPKVWEINGAIYIINIASLKTKTISDFEKIIKYEMDDITSHDIDSMTDFEFAEFMSSKKAENDKQD